MPYSSFMYGDPLNILINRENRTCKGCIHQRTEQAFKIEVNYCAKGKKEMRKCDHYSDKPKKE